MLTDRAWTKVWSAHPAIFLAPQGVKNKGHAGLQFYYFINVVLLSFSAVKSLIKLSVEKDVPNAIRIQTAIEEIFDLFNLAATFS